MMSVARPLLSEVQVVQIYAAVFLVDRLRIACGGIGSRQV